VLALKPQQEDALFGRALALKAGNQLAAAKAAFEQLVGLANGSRANDARRDRVDRAAARAGEARRGIRPRGAGSGR